MPRVRAEGEDGEEGPPWKRVLKREKDSFCGGLILKMVEQNSFRTEKYKWSISHQPNKADMKITSVAFLFLSVLQIVF